MTTQDDNRLAKYRAFKALHDQPGTFVIPNPWDAGTARILTALGFKALATTSAGYAFAAGVRDSTGYTNREGLLNNAESIAAATELPVSADLENGFGADPETCAETIVAAGKIGLAGGSIEDSTGDRRASIYDFNQSVERIQAAAEAAQAHSVFLTARAENFINGRKDFDDTLKRLVAYAEAGADAVYAPGLPDLDAIKTVCATLDKPVNVLMGLSGATYTVEELAVAGVKRISVGGSMARAALGEFIRAAEEVRDQGTFTYATRAVADRDAAAYMAKP